MIKQKDNSRPTKENSKPREARAAKTEKPRRSSATKVERDGAQARAKRSPTTVLCVPPVLPAINLPLRKNLRNPMPRVPCA